MTKSIVDLVLFDLNGTLAHQVSRGQWKLRPGVHHLLRLQERGMRIGLFTNKARHNIPLQLFMSHGIHFDFILDQNDCEPAPGDSHSRQKSLSRHFPSETVEETLRLVDDDRTKGVLNEEHLLLHIPTWDGTDDDDVCLENLLLHPASFL